MWLPFQNFAEGFIQALPLEICKVQSIAQIANAIRNVLEKVVSPGRIASYITNEISSIKPLFIYPEKLLQVHDAGRSTICPAKGHTAFNLHQILNVTHEKSARPQVKARAELTHGALQP